MENHLNIFFDAIHQKRLVKVRVNTKEKGIVERKCVPFDFGPSNKFRDKEERFHFFDLNSPDGSHILSVLPSQLLNIQFLNDTFDPADYVTWSPIKWHIKRNWGKYS